MNNFPETQNESFGFHGTVVAAGHSPVFACTLYERAGLALVEQDKDMSMTEARDVLDFPFGRHLADKVLSGHDAKEVLSNRSWRKFLRETVKAVKRYQAENAK